MSQITISVAKARQRTAVISDGADASPSRRDISGMMAVNQGDDECPYDPTSSFDRDDGSGSLFRALRGDRKTASSDGKLFRLVSAHVRSNAGLPVTPAAGQSLIQRLVSVAHLGQRWVASCSVFSDSELFREMRTIKTRQFGHVTKPTGRLTSPPVSRRCRTNCASAMSSSSRTKARAGDLFQGGRPAQR